MLAARYQIVKRHFIAAAPRVTIGMPAGILLFAAIAGMAPLQCATLERLTLDDMIAKSTVIVRGRVTDSWAAFTGSIIYTHYQLEISETFKGAGANRLEVVVTGGTADGVDRKSVV